MYAPSAIDQWLEGLRPGRSIELPSVPVAGRSSVASRVQGSKAPAHALQPVTSRVIARLVQSAQGAIPSSELGRRSEPSGRSSALRLLVLYVALPNGLFRYDPDSHRLRYLLQEDVRPGLILAASNQNVFRRARVVFVISILRDRSVAKFGHRVERFGQLEAGHAAQNLLLEAHALELAAAPVREFDELIVSQLLHLTAFKETPVYLIPTACRDDRETVSRPISFC